MQRLLSSVCTANTGRISGFESTDHLPTYSFVRRFVDRKKLSLRRSMQISKGSQICSVADLQSWQQDIHQLVFSDPSYSEVFQDSRRHFNTGETLIDLGMENHRVIAEKGTKVLCTISAGSGEHITAVFTVSASGDCVPVRIIMKGVRNVAQTHLAHMDKGRLSGEWNFSVSEKGFITQELFLDVLADLDRFLTVNNVPRPVFLWTEGSTTHISLGKQSFL